MRKLKGAVLALSIAVAMAAFGIGAGTAHATTAVYWSTLYSPTSTNTCANYSPASVGGGDVRRRNNYSTGRPTACIGTSSGSWWFGAYYNGGGVITCGASGSTATTCGLNSGLQGDPYIKNIGGSPASATGAFFW